jgi:periplasmic divalent cation tolerance protein
LQHPDAIHRVLNMTDLVIVLTTIGDEERAETLARQLVQERLAACVNVQGPMVSLYRWQGRLERESERQLVIKTTRRRLAALESRLDELHPYEVPEFLVLPVEGASDAYARWVDEETRPS